MPAVDKPSAKSFVIFFISLISSPILPVVSKTKTMSAFFVVTQSKCVCNSLQTGIVTIGSTKFGVLTGVKGACLIVSGNFGIATSSSLGITAIAV